MFRTELNKHELNDFITKYPVLKKTFLYFTILFSLLATHSPAQATVHVTQTIRTYTVSGNTIRDVVRSMKQRGPFHRESGRKAVGLADFRHRIRLKTSTGKGICKVASVDITLKIFLTLPGLSNRARLTGHHRQRWRRIEQMVSSHEKRHASYYRQFANNLHRRLLKLGSQTNCAALHRQVRTIERQELARDRQRNKAYDRATYKGFNTRLRRLSR